MTLNIDVSADLMAKLEREASTSGRDLHSLVVSALEEMVSLADEQIPPNSIAGREQRAAEWVAWASRHHCLGKPVDDSRESIYEGRGE